MSIIDKVKTSERLRQKVSGVWLIAVLSSGITALHFTTDFDVINPDWWVHYIRAIGLDQEFLLPYTYYFVGMILVYYIMSLIFKYSFKRTEYGNASIATEKDLKAMELRGKDSVVIGEFKDKKIIPENIRHSLVVAGTRSGKTQGIAIPTLYEYKGSIVVIDPKGELWEKTSGKRSEFSDCYRLEWTSRDTCKYNPISLDVLPDDAAEIELRVLQIASILGPSGDSYWDKAGTKLLAGLLMLEIFDAIHEGRESSLTTVAHYAGETSDITEEMKEELGKSPLQCKLYMDGARAAERNYPRSVSSNLNKLSDMAMSQLGGFFDTLDAEISILSSAAVENSISGCDINSHMLVAGERPVTVYVVIKPKDSQPTAILTTMLITNFVFDLVSRSDAEAKSQHSCLFLLEEFSAMKRTAAIGELFDRGAGLGVHGLIIIQSLSQVRQIYSKDELDSFINNADYIVIFAVTDVDTQKWLESVVGKTTQKRESLSDQDKGSQSFSTSYEGVPLILAQEWGEISPGEHRILVRYNTTCPIYAKTGFAWKDKEAKKWMSYPEPPRIAS